MAVPFVTMIVPKFPCYGSTSSFKYCSYPSHYSYTPSFRDLGCFQRMKYRQQKRPQPSTNIHNASAGQVIGDTEPLNIDKLASEVYQPCIWDYDYLQSLGHQAQQDPHHGEHVAELKKIVRCEFLNNKDINPLDRLEIIDDIDRLGLGYHFEEDIRTLMDNISKSTSAAHGCIEEQGLFETSLRFRLLRKYGHNVSQDVFNRFKGLDGNFIACLCDDVKGILSLYEASFFAVPGEETLDEANNFSTTHLMKLKHKNSPDEVISREISHALELPRHWRLPMEEARWYIDTYQMKRQNMFPAILELAKLEFNVLQVMLQKELAQLIRWWKDLGLKENLEFVRDRLVESYLWGLGTCEPKYSKSRIAIAKVTALIAVIDDVYDVYGSFNELKIFTHTVERWDMSDSNNLPRSLRLCLMSLFNTVNEMAYHILKEEGLDALPYFKQSWVDLCNAYMNEAEIVTSGHTQTLEQYMKNAWVSIAVCILMSHAYLSTKESCILSEERLNYIFSSDICKWCSMKVRFLDDLTTSKAEVERGDILKAEQWYRLETGASEEVARGYIWNQVGEMWKNMNNVWLENSGVPQTFIMFAMDISRASHYIYLNGNRDSFGAPDDEDKRRVMSLIIQPISG